MRYTLITQWHLNAPIDRVWNALAATERWPDWWPYVKEVVEINPGAADGVGSIQRYTWSSRLPYRLCFTVRTAAVNRPYDIEGIASGDLNGVGRWHLQTLDAGTQVTYTWIVSTEKAWMNLLAPILAPVFAWNHDRVMHEGGKGMARHLGVDLLDFRGSAGSGGNRKPA